MLPNLGRLSLQQADTRVVFRYNDKEYWDEKYPQIGDDRCAICLGNIEENDNVAVLSCTHFFHEACIREWVVRNNRCPTCREPLPPNDLERIKGPLTPEESFLEAAEEGDLAKVTQMLKDGIDVNAQDEKGYTALMWACAEKHADVAIALLKVDGIRVDLVKKHGNTVLQCASHHGMLEVVEKLIEKNADVNIQDEDGDTALITACENKHADVAIALLEHPYIKVNLANNKGETALYKASEKGMLAVVEKLIKRGADVNVQAKNGDTALIVACKAKTKKHALVALALLERTDIDVDLVTKRGSTALQWASNRGMLAVVQKLIAKDADVNIQDKNGDTALIKACYRNNEKCALALLERKDIEVDLEDKNGDTALDWAFKNELLSVVKKLIAKGADVNKHNKYGYTPLIKACKENNKKYALALLERTYIEVNLVNNHGETALYWASEKGMLAVVEKLIEKGADVNIQNEDGYTALMKFWQANVALALLEDDNINVNLKNKDGYTALHKASFLGNLLRMLAVVKKLIERGADVNAQDKDGRTALMIACQETTKYADVALALLEDDNIKVDLVDEYGKTALDYASENRMTEVVKKLIERRADVNIQDENGDTALIGACKKNRVNVALALLEHPYIEVNLMNNNGETALGWAFKNGLLEVVKKLIKRGADTNKQNDQGETMLMKSIFRKHTNVALALLEDDNIKVNLVTNKGETALHRASEKGMLEVVMELITKGADVNVQDEYGFTALIVACANKHADVALALLERKDIEVDLEDKDGDTALDYASKNGTTEVVERIREIQSRRASDDVTPMEVDVVSPDDRRDTSDEERRIRPRIQATTAGRLRVRLQKLV